MEWTDATKKWNVWINGFAKNFEENNLNFEENNWHVWKNGFGKNVEEYFEEYKLWWYFNFEISNKAWLKFDENYVEMW